MNTIINEKFIRQVVRNSIKEYVNLLQQDTFNQKYSNLVSTLFLSSLNFSEWLKNITVTDFGVVSYIGEKFENRFFNFAEMDKTNIHLNEIKEIGDERYFFTCLHFKNLRDLHNYASGFYYIHERNLICKIDSLLLSALKGFNKKRGKSSIYSKKLRENVFLNFDCNKKRNNFSSIDRYLFPDLSIDVNSINYKFSNDTDLNTLLLIPGNSYFVFYTCSHEFIKDSNGELVQVIRKEDEPLTYKSEDVEGFYLANSSENVARYNKFIYCTIELFIHYFKIFEKWIDTVFLPKLLTPNDADL